MTVVSVALLTAWSAVELRIRHPLIDLRLWRYRPVLAANATGLLVSIGFYPPRCGYGVRPRPCA
ncbi:MAG TPA: hypothetical protein VF060_09610 [Trebonia sp.]